MTSVSSTDSATVEKAVTEVTQVEATQNIEQYSVLTRLEKSFIIAIISYASWSANLSTFIYLPALKPMSEAFSVSVAKINLTVTIYQAVGAVVPLFVGDAADVLGRRATYIVTLCFFMVANICLALAESYTTLLGLRVLQAVGQSGIILIGYGVVSDIAPPATRGSFMSVVSFFITIGPSLGPILGGVLTYAAGWSWIFWFLAIITCSCFVLVALFLPETSRNIVDDGSVAPPAVLRLPIPFSTFMRHYKHDNDELEHVRSRIPNPMRSLKTLFRKDNAVVVLAMGLHYAVYSSITVSLSTLFLDIYHLSEWQVGLIYLPFALGGTISTLFSGRLLDGAYRKARTKRGLSTDRIKGDDLDNFPIEKARLDVVWLPMLAIVVCTVAYGWILQYRLHLAIPMVLQFITGMAMQLNFSSFNTLLVDINHRSPSAANASTSVVRYAFSAVVVAYMEDMFQSLGIGWSFTLIAGFIVIGLGFLAMEYVYGMIWRKEAARKLKRRKHRMC